MFTFQAIYAGACNRELIADVRTRFYCGVYIYLGDLHSNRNDMLMAR